MQEPAPKLEINPATRQSLALRLFEILLIVLVCFAFGGDAPPHENEAHYLSRLKHYWQPTWCAGDLFLNSADTQLVFIWTFGWVTRWLSLSATAWLGRAIAWIFLAWAWRRLSWRLVSLPFASVLSAELFISLNEIFHLAGEWIIGGVEAKCFAYVFVLLALSDLVDNRWNRLWLTIGAAAAFHPIVGGWSGVACGGVWLLSQVGLFGDTPALSLPSALKAAIDMLPGLVVGGLLALLGVLPALRLTWNVPPDVADSAARIYVFERLPHHLALLALPTAEMHERLARHAALLVFMLLLSRAFVRVTSPENSRHSSAAIDRSGLSRIVGFAWVSAFLAIVGFAIELALWNNPALAAKLLRYYWFRSTDFAAPLAVALLATALVSAGFARRRAWAAWALAASLAFAGWHLVDRTWQRIIHPGPPADQRLTNIPAWADACDWIATHTESDALFLTPRMGQSFKWRTGRAEVVTRKDMPQDAPSIVEWSKRYHHIYFEDVPPGPESPPSIGQLGTDRVRQLAKEYGVKYVVASRWKPLWFTVVYPNQEFPNEEYVVYRVDEPSASKPESDNGR